MGLGAVEEAGDAKSKVLKSCMFCFCSVSEVHLTDEMLNSEDEVREDTGELSDLTDLDE